MMNDVNLKTTYGKPKTLDDCESPIPSLSPSKPPDVSEDAGSESSPRRRRMILILVLVIIVMHSFTSWEMPRVRANGTLDNSRHWDWMVGYLGDWQFSWDSSDRAVAFLSTVLSIALSISAAWPYYMVYRGWALLSSLPGKFTAMSIANSLVGFHCGLWLNDPVIFVSCGFTVMWMLLCCGVKEYISVTYGLNTLSVSVKRLVTTLGVLALVFCGLTFLSDGIKELLWMVTQILPNIALMLDYRQALINKDIQGISIPMLAACLACNSLWLLYGISRDSFAIIVPSVTGIVLPGSGLVVHHSLRTGKHAQIVFQLLFASKGAHWADIDPSGVHDIGS